MEHVYRQNTLFDGVRKEGMAPQRKIVDKIYHANITQTIWLISGGRPHRNDLAKTFELKRLNILFQLEYWKVKINPP
jgi:hypothetical protein